MTSSEENNEGRKPVFSILVASFNLEATIERTLNSIQAQTYRDFQCFVSDDCSQDRTLTLVEPYSQSDSRFRILRNSENLGWIVNVNQLLDLADTEFFMIMPHDDVIAPQY